MMTWHSSGAFWSLILAAAAVAGDQSAVIDLAASRPRTFVSPGEAQPGPDCSSRCASVCQRISCSGLTIGQCSRERNSCRTSCSTRC